MPRFGAASLANLSQLHPSLQKIYLKAIEAWDCQIIDGARTVAEQIKNVAKGVSKTMDSRHIPGADGFSHAADVMPFPFDWNKIQRGLDAVKRADGGMEVLEVYAFQGFIAGIAHAYGVPIRQGVDWNTNKQFDDQTFNDLPHTEIPK